MNAVPEPIKKRPVMFFGAADEKNFPHAVMFWNSLTKFHSPKDIDMIMFTSETRPEELKKLPQGIKTVDITAQLKADPMFWYRQKPVLAEPYMSQYDLVVGFDIDQLVLGDLSYLIKTKDYDIAAPLNYNRNDAEQYGLVGGWCILPIEYANCGLVCMRSEQFVHEWKVWCFSPQFDRAQYKEQDGLNIKIYHQNYNARILDHLDPIGGNNSWWGLLGKSDWSRTKMVNNEVIIPKGEGEPPFPPKDVSLKIAHFAGGQDNPQKMNYRTVFPDDVVERIDYLVSSKK